MIGCAKSAPRNINSTIVGDIGAAVDSPGPIRDSHRLAHDDPPLLRNDAANCDTLAALGAHLPACAGTAFGLRDPSASGGGSRVPDNAGRDGVGQHSLLPDARYEAICG